ncbi:MAG: hypothetical protein K9G58_07505 [Bacteroidales bacterium]|nr:hypothetical protein [Bacteroidales bacterium]
MLYKKLTIPVLLILMLVLALNTSPGYLSSEDASLQYRDTTHLSVRQTDTIVLINANGHEQSMGIVHDTAKISGPKKEPSLFIRYMTYYYMIVNATIHKNL